VDSNGQRCEHPATFFYAFAEHSQQSWWAYRLNHCRNKALNTAPSVNRTYAQGALLMPLQLPSNTIRSASVETIRAVRSFYTPAIGRVVVLLFAFELLLLILPVLSRAQSIQYTHDKPDQALRSVMRVDPSTLGLSIDVPIANYPGRGGTSMPISLSYSSKQWRIAFEESWLSIGGGLLRTESIPMFSEWAKAGWTTSADIPIIEWTGASQHYNSDGTPFCGDCGDSGGYYIKRIQVHMPGGSSHELRIDDTATTSPATIGSYFAVDSSNLRYEASSFTEGVLYLPDGSRYQLNATSAQYVDRNGNMLSYSVTNRQWTDTQNRVLDVPLPESLSATTYTYYLPSTTGTPLSYSVRWSTLGKALTNPDEELHYKTNMTFLPGESFDERGPALFIGDGASRLYDGPGFPASEKFNPLVLAEIILPSGQHYLFTYNVFGEISKVEYPTGAYELFEHGKVAGASFLSTPYDQGNRGVINRSLSPTGAIEDEVHWHYDAVKSNFVLTTSSTAPDNTVSQHLMKAETSEGSYTFGFLWAELGLAFEERAFAPGSAGQLGPMLRRTLKSWTTSGPTAGGWVAATRNPRVIKQVSILLEPEASNALSSMSTMTYDDDLNIIATKHYAFTSLGQSSAQTLGITSFTEDPLLLLRTDEATYLVNDPDISSATRSAYRNRNLLSLPTSTRVKNGSGTVAQTKTYFDNYDGNGGTGSYPLLPYEGLVNAWTDTGNIRGLPTTVRVWLNTTNSYLQTRAQYDQFGNVRKIWDANDKLSEMTYSSEYAYAYPTGATTAVPDPTGDYGSSTALSTTATYNGNAGLIASLIDANGQTTSYSYDAINRPTTIMRPSGGGSTSYNYGDTPGNLYVRTQTSLDSTRVVESYQYYDNLGRPCRTFLNEGSTYSTTDTQYNSMGRSWRVSTPYRTTSPTGCVDNPEAAWTTSVYDYLGRVTSVTTSDGAVVSSAYSASTSTPLGPVVTFTDQAGKLRRNLWDALGRLVRVDEPDNSSITGNLGTVAEPLQPTSYSYDLLGNLVLVTQGNQTRSFVYDSLSRLQSATNPESGMTCYGTVINHQCQADGYDANGNLLYKTDARGVRQTSSYDALNRNTTINYSNTSIGSPDVPDITRLYDGATNGKGRLWQSYAGGTEAVGANVDHMKITSYDEMGRAKVQRQRFKVTGAWSEEIYETSRSYNLAGAVTLQNYPSGHSVIFNYDGVGRLSDKDSQNLAFSGNLGGVARTYSRGITYDAMGAVQQEQFGTDIAVYNRFAYNSRGQLAEIKASTTPNDSSWNRGKFVNWYSLQCGLVGSPVCNSADNNGNLRKQETFVPNSDGSTTSWYQQYEYDSLNRMTEVTENANSTLLWHQSFSYDRYGNRTITGGINNQSFEVEATTNRLLAPGDPALSAEIPSPRKMRYDAAGNLTNDSWSSYGSSNAGEITRIYDAENRMTSALDSSGGLSAYTYNADGQRVRRKSSGMETWQVYGMDGELVAEYAQGGSKLTPQKEYGYRNGQLLITAESGSANAPPPTLLIATPPISGASVTLNWTAASGATKYRVEQKGAVGSFIKIGTTASNSYVDNTAESGKAYLYKVCAANAQENCISTYSNVVLGAAVTFPTDATLKTFLEDPVNVTSVKAAHITELRSAVNAVRILAGLPVATWTYSNLVSGNTIHVEDVRELRANLGSALLQLQIQTPTYTDSTIKGFVEDPLNATTIRAAHIRELRLCATSGIGGSGGGGSAPQIHWLVTDQLGTPRIVFDQSGALDKVSRHDYLPFGEELFAATGGRTTTQGYAPPDISPADGVRQKFTSYEHDMETKLDFAQARYYSSSQGRFTSPDPGNAGTKLSDPQSWNGYTYSLNNPLRYVDPNGLRWAQVTGAGVITYQWFDDQTRDDNGQTEYDRALSSGWSAVTFNESKPFSYTNGVFAPGETLQTVTLQPNGQINESYHTVTWGEWAKVYFLFTFIDVGTAFQSQITGQEATNLRDKLINDFVNNLNNQGNTNIAPTLPSVPGPATGSTKLTKPERRKLGNLISRAEEKVADVIRSRGGGADNVRKAGPWAEKTLAETAKAAINGDGTAETAIKVAKGAGRLGQRY
jgi:RHS repeat-associated protein